MGKATLRESGVWMYWPQTLFKSSYNIWLILKKFENETYQIIEGDSSRALL